MELNINFNELSYCTEFTKGIFIKILKFFFPFQIKNKIKNKNYIEIKLQKPIKLLCDSSFTYNINFNQLI